MGLLVPIHPSALPASSFNLKDMAPGLGSETRLDRSKGDTRSDTVLLDSSATLITNEGRVGAGREPSWDWEWVSKREAVLECPPSLPWTDNEETEGSDVPTDYLLGDVEGEDDELYLLDPEHAHCKWGRGEGVGWGWEAGPEPAYPSCPYVIAEEPEYVLPQEAFPLRHEIVDTPPGPEHLQDKADSPHVSGSEADAASLVPVDSSFSLISVSHALCDSRLPPDFFSALVCDMLRFYAEQGDVQMAVSVLIVLGERVRKDIDEQTQVGDRVWGSSRSSCHPEDCPCTPRLHPHLCLCPGNPGFLLRPPRPAHQEHWYTSYIDLLQRFCLWNVSNQVVKLSTSRAISCLNQASTTLHVICSHCNRPMSSRGWVCDRCRRCASMCAVCHHVVKGLFVWCQGCSHGGHLQHIMKWLEGSSHCPAGCGHLCEYS